MRIFDPKDQLGNSLLSSADTQKSSVKLEKQMAVGGGAITLTSTDISDIENWELSNASLLIEGQTYSFLPESVRNSDGSLTIDFGTEFSKATLVLKRAVFDGMKPITIEVRIKRLMAKTMATAGKEGYDAEANVAEWRALGREAKSTGDEKYAFAELTKFPDAITISSTTFDKFLISAKTVPFFNTIRQYGIYLTFDPTTISELVWEADLPCLTGGENPYGGGANLFTFVSQRRPITWKGELPNLSIGTDLFSNAPLVSFEVQLPSLVKATRMFSGCKTLTSFQCDMPSGLTTYASGMFSGCKLDLTSVERISRTIAVCVDEGSITLGVSSELEGDETFNGYIETMRKSVAEGGKGWIVAVKYNGDEES